MIEFSIHSINPDHYQDVLQDDELDARGGGGACIKTIRSTSLDLDESVAEHLQRLLFDARLDPGLYVAVISKADGPDANLVTNWSWVVEVEAPPRWEVTVRR